MADDKRFSESYLALVAVIWDALEGIDRMLEEASGDPTAWEVQSRLQWLRMELLQLGERSRRRAGSALLSTVQDVAIQRFVAKLLGWLEIDASASIDVARMRVRSAQNWLFDEACIHADTESHAATGQPQAWPLVGRDAANVHLA